MKVIPSPEKKTPGTPFSSSTVQSVHVIKTNNRTASLLPNKQCRMPRYTNSLICVNSGPISRQALHQDGSSVVGFWTGKELDLEAMISDSVVC